MSKKKYAPGRIFDTTDRDELLKDPEHAARYLEECFGADGDLASLRQALKEVVKANGGMAALAAKTNLNRENLYRALSKDGNPQMATIDKVLKAMGMRIAIVPGKIVAGKTVHA